MKRTSKKPTQVDKILRHLKEHKYISTFEAFNEYNITRLGSRIWDIKQMGYDIGSDMISRKNLRGEVVSFKRYYLKS